jgi:hypothetical protein
MMMLIFITLLSVQSLPSPTDEHDIFWNVLFDTNLLTPRIQETEESFYEAFQELHEDIKWSEFASPVQNPPEDIDLGDLGSALIGVSVPEETTPALPLLPSKTIRMEEIVETITLPAPILAPAPAQVPINPLNNIRKITHQPEKVRVEGVIL